jgi:hypothetical protein
MTNSTDRTRILTVNSDTIGKMFRLVPHPGSGGKAQIFNVTYDAIREPCYLTSWDSYEMVFGFAGYKFIKQVWVEYVCAGTIVVSIYRDNGQLFYQKQLPAHAQRNVENFLVPDKNPTTGALNTSKVNRVVISSSDTSKPFKMYKDGTRIENMSRTGDQRQAYKQHVLWTEKPLEA